MTERTHRKQRDEISDCGQTDEEARAFDGNLKHAGYFRQERPQPSALDAEDQEARVGESGQPALDAH